MKFPLKEPISLWDKEKKCIRKDVCDNCHGTGKIRGGAPDTECECNVCKGSGKNPKFKHLF